MKLSKVIKVPPKSIIILILYIFLNPSCKKNPNDNIISFNLTLRDSLYKYAQDVYLWNESLPSYQEFLNSNHPSGRTNEDILRNDILYISRYAINKRTGKSYEFIESNPDIPKYSKIISYSTNNHDKKNFGFSLVIKDKELFIQYVVPGSPSHNESLKRGDKILRINSKKAPLNIDDIEKNLESNQLQLQIQRANRIFEVLLFKDSYNLFPINSISLLKPKTGYISLLQFSNISLEQLQTAINNLGDIDNLIIDLRYNGGGYVNLVDELANLIIPYSLNQNVMRKEQYNPLMQSGKAYSLLNQVLRKSDGTPLLTDNNRVATLFDINYSINANTYLFNKKTGIPNLKKVIFIVSEKTASASELLISIIKPYIDTKIIGVSASGEKNIRTYGKPVGYFKITLDKFDIYLSMFKNLNKNNEGDYYDGIPADYSVVDNVNNDFGNEKDESIATAISIINNYKTFPSQQPVNILRYSPKEIKSISPPIDILIKRF